MDTNMTTNDQKVTTVQLTATVVREQEDVLTVRLSDGFANAEVVVHRHAATPDTTADDFVRLPLMMAGAMTRRLRDHSPNRQSWLQKTPNDLLDRLEQEAVALRAAIKRDGSRVLDCAADVSVAALMLADKADKLEPMPELLEEVN
jgi:hypothetical protein